MAQTPDAIWVSYSPHLNGFGDHQAWHPMRWTSGKCRFAFPVFAPPSLILHFHYHAGVQRDILDMILAWTLLGRILW